MKKLLVFGVIVLFLGVVIAPSINANISKASVDSELVEFTTEICGLDGGKHTVQLTQCQIKQLDKLFDGIREQLNKAETREDFIESFNRAIQVFKKEGYLGLPPSQ